jgi:pyruvate/2-oxoglutarate dehydrogenase complex dihydrolipoamide acyltransferase (E2) component
MVTEVIMPKLGLTMNEGKILLWYKTEGETVKVGESLLNVETDKVSLDVEAPASGVLLKILHPAGDSIPLETVIAYIGEIGEKPLNKIDFASSVWRKNNLILNIAIGYPF